MSKSDPNSAIFMEDSAADVERKISNAFCPERTIDGNPCIKYITLIILPWAGTFTASLTDGTSRYVLLHKNFTYKVLLHMSVGMHYFAG